MNQNQLIIVAVVIVGGLGLMAGFLMMNSSGTPEENSPERLENIEDPGTAGPSAPSGTPINTGTVRPEQPLSNAAVHTGPLVNTKLAINGVDYTLGKGGILYSPNGTAVGNWLAKENRVTIIPLSGRQITGLVENGRFAGAQPVGGDGENR